ncbi:MAG: NAD(+)/NADH kinase [Chloroflexi bacterium]|nr:NAD(+)/NADH kinase [Chloroflexota bacterium]
MKKVGFIYHPKLERAVALAQELARALEGKKAAPWLSSAWDEDGARAHVPGSELLVSIGGDGTMLRATRMAVPWGVPVLGVNLGRLGFITELGPEEVVEALPHFLAGEGCVDERALLQVELKGEALHSLALNDAVVGRGKDPRVVYVETVIDGEPLTTFKADGVLVSTATGSTGYALAAGGPILSPWSQDLLLKAIAPHLSLAFALVLPPEAAVELRVHCDHQASLTLDGQIERPLEDGDLVRVRRSPLMARFLRRQTTGIFYRTLVERLSRQNRGSGG